MPFLLASNDTDPVTDVSISNSEPSLVLYFIGNLKFDTPTCCICLLTPLIKLAGPF